MKKTISMILSLAMILCTFACLGITATADGAIDVTADVTMEDAGTAISADTTTILVKLGGHSCLPASGGGFFSNDNPATNGIDVLNYVEINGVAARQIVSDNQNSVTSYTGTVFPMNIGGVYSPIMEFCEESYFRFSVLNDYAAQGTFTVTLKSGFTWANNNGETLTVTDDVTYGYGTNGFAKIESAKEIALSEGGIVTSADYVQVGIQVANGGNLPGIGYHFSEIKSAFPAVSANLLVNGKSVAQINDEYDGSYTYTEFPATAGRAYQDPVYLFADNGVIWVKIAKPYFSTLPAHFDITFTDDFTYDLDGKTYVVSADKTFAVEKTGAAAAKFVSFGTVTDFSIPTCANMATAEGYQCFNMVFDREIADMATIGYDGLTANYAMMDQILINGKSVAQINAETATTGYAFNYFPASAIDSFKLPIVVFVSANNIELKINNAYYDTVKDDFSVVILPDFFAVVNGTKYTMPTGFKYIDGAVRLDSMFNVGFQLRQNTAEKRIRFLSMADTVDYDKFIYTIVIDGVTTIIELDDAYTSVLANGVEVKPSDINANANYFSLFEFDMTGGNYYGKTALVSVGAVKGDTVYYSADRLIQLP